MATLIDEITTTVAKKTKLKPPQARKAVELTLEILMDELPAPFAAQMDAIVKGVDVGAATDMLGGLLGSNKK
jgi:hypothetical protein